MKKVDYENFIRWQEKLKKTDSFLDIGCWSGKKVLELNSKCNAYGADFNRKTLSLANKKIKKKLVYCDITKNKPFDKKFDWILLSEVIEHIEKESEAIKNISDSLKKGGKLILTTPRSIRFLEFWDPAWVGWKIGGRGRHYHYTLNELRKLLEIGSFRIKKYAIRGNFSWIIRRWVNVILKFLFKSKKMVKNYWGEGFVNWMILAEKI